MILLDDETLAPVTVQPVRRQRQGRPVVIPRGTVRALLRSGERVRLETIGLTIGERAEPPEGMRIVASHWERDRDGVPVMVIDNTEPLPERAPDPWDERLALLETRLDEFEAERGGEP